PGRPGRWRAPRSAGGGPDPRRRSARDCGDADAGGAAAAARVPCGSGRRRAGAFGERSTSGPAAQATLMYLMLSPISRAIDLAVLARLNFVEVDKPVVIDLAPADPVAFWHDSRVADPRPIRVLRSWRGSDPSGWDELDLSGQSEGPGAHAGSRALAATAHIRRADAAAHPLVLMLHGYAVPV